MSYLDTVESQQGARIVVRGKTYLNLCSNNYLGFASDARLKEAAIAAIEQYGVGTTSVRALIGSHSLHEELETKLAAFKKAEAAIVLTGGYLANMAAIQTTIGKDDIIVSDELNHASIIDAVRLSGCQNKFIYKHADMDDLRRQLPKIQSAGGPDRTILIITDGVFSMDGDIAPLPELVVIAQKIGAKLMVDDAHGEGVLGSHGRGIVDHFNLHGKVDIEVGTLSKAFGVMGGFITGSTELITTYKQKARQFLFTNALSIPDTAALIAAVDILTASDERVKALWDNATYLKTHLQKAGFNTGTTETPIIPVMIGSEETAKLFGEKLREKAVMATPIVFPMVPQNTARLRLQPSAIHTHADLDEGIKAIIEVGTELKVI